MGDVRGSTGAMPGAPGRAARLRHGLARAPGIPYHRPLPAAPVAALPGRRPDPEPNHGVP